MNRSTTEHDGYSLRMYWYFKHGFALESFDSVTARSVLTWSEHRNEIVFYFLILCGQYALSPCKS